VKVRQKPLMVFFLLASAPIPALGQDPQEPGVAEGSAHISGSVTDHQTGEAIGGATVILHAVEEPGTSFRLTSERGLFHFGSIKAQRYEVEVTFLGYKPVEVQVRAGDGDDTRIDVGMVPTVVELEPMVVTATRRSLLHRVGFHDRRRFGLGQFVTREDIEGRNLFQVSDLFRTMAGFRVASGSHGTHSQILGRGNCPPALYVDGIRTVEGGGIDEVLRPEHLEGLEVYHQAQAPAQYRGSRCGVVLAWTRSPERDPDASPLTWRRVLFALGFLGLAFTATSF
jgi:hypothetical protein